ncbi:polyprenyl diphosphate synthase [Marinobacterium sediminicola]|uniref:Ditrans,polycis-undecaprenyl-diphosphate synthase ((2E,6E)-farnesyl-diphosphate specific) n=1 Tax=Marinobacterium sediminicola TaxID=518898 RepID=A0ABY1S0E5_9GAMM|nr:polyprenyl diphosphate synthase [Marinobacterium sediminicola]ULG69687.1 polyprenyl diphosphate synthase [Marinobacterium sediminicola]SMR74585.1 undecaprenyl diphosphate synthase [Marinobacterium sediminicola]
MTSEHQLIIPPGRSMPRHIAIIMDGNNRWAKERRLPGLAGHKAGVNSVRAVIEGCVEQGVEALTLFAFSSENWKRPALEVKGLMQLFMRALEHEVRKLHRHNIRLRIVGDLSRFSPELQKRIRDAEELTAGNTGLALNIAANYGGRWDIVQAARSLAQRCVDGELDPADITEDLFNEQVSLADLAPPDLCIRTGGEQRISNFLIWQFAYTEFYFSDCFWPDFDKAELFAALQSFLTRERRFGRTSEQLEADKRC